MSHPPPAFELRFPVDARSDSAPNTSPLAEKYSWSQAAPPDNRLWRVIAVVGLLLALLMALPGSVPLQPRQGRLVVCAMVLAVVTLLALRLVFAAPWRRLRAQPDLLVPVGVVAGLSRLLDVLVQSPRLAAVFSPAWSLRIPGLALSVSFASVLNILLWTAFAAWQTDLLYRGLCGERPLRLSPWSSLQQHFLRTLVVLLIGVAVLLLAMVPLLAVAMVLFLVALPAIGVLAVIWNLATAALLPVALFDPTPLGRALGNGFRRSWQLKGCWWRPLLVQLLLLGIFVLLRAHFTSSPGHPTIRTQTNVQWQVNAFWVGGYENGCRWYTKYAEALETPMVPAATQGLSLLMLVLAVAMKMTVIGHLLDFTSTEQRELPASTQVDPR